jgi:Mg2+ and Co2+ transporter CorA
MQQPTMISSLTDHDLDQLYEQLKHHMDIVDDQSPGVTTEEMERMVNESNQNLLQVRDEMRASVADLKAEVTNISNSVKKQNAVVVMLQKTLEATSTDLKTSINQQVADLSAQIQGLRTLVISLMPPMALQAAEQSGGHASS